MDQLLNVLSISDYRSITHNTRDDPVLETRLMWVKLLNKSYIVNS